MCIRDRLQVVGAQLGLPVFEMGQIDPVTIAVEAVKYAKDHGNDIVFLDTAGRLHIDEQLMDELKRVKAAVKPSEILLVVDAMTCLLSTSDPARMFVNRRLDGQATVLPDRSEERPIADGPAEADRPAKAPAESAALAVLPFIQ